MTDDVDDFLEHFGVKGMRWGVRNEKDTGGEESSVQKALKANPPPKLSKKQQAQLAINEKKHDAHFDKSEEEPHKGWRPTKTQVAVVAVGAVAAGVIIYKIKSDKKIPSGFSERDYLKAVRSAETPSWVSEFSGKHMSRADFKGLISNSKGRVWTGPHITKESFDQPAIDFAKGHRFFRVSRAAEKSFGVSTYATSSEVEFSRYLHSHSIANALDARRVTFDAVDSVRIPNLHTQLEAMRKVLVGEGRTRVKPVEVVEELAGMSGGGWSSSRASTFISALRAQGYHGIIDQMDAGVYSEAPLVLFDGSRFGPKTSVLTSSLDLKHLADILTDIPNRR